MKNMDSKEWEFTNGEKYAINWLEKNGFDVVLRRRTITRDFFIVTKDDISYDFRLPLGDSKINYKGIMEQFAYSFELYCKLKRGEN